MVSIEINVLTLSILLTIRYSIFTIFSIMKDRQSSDSPLRQIPFDTQESHEVEYYRMAQPLGNSIEPGKARYVIGLMPSLENRRSRILREAQD